MLTRNLRNFSDARYQIFGNKYVCTTGVLAVFHHFFLWSEKFSLNLSFVIFSRRNLCLVLNCQRPLIMKHALKPTDKKVLTLTRIY